MDLCNFCRKHSTAYRETCPECTQEEVVLRAQNGDAHAALILRAQSGDVDAWAELARNNKYRKLAAFDSSTTTLQNESVSDYIRRLIADPKNTRQLSTEPSPIFDAFAEAMGPSFYKKWKAGEPVSLGRWEEQTDHDREFLQACGISAE